MLTLLPSYSLSALMEQLKLHQSFDLGGKYLRDAHHLQVSLLSEGLH